MVIEPTLGMYCLYYVIVSIETICRQKAFKKSHNSRKISVAVVCTALSGNEPHRQVGMNRMMSSGRLDGVIVNTLVASRIKPTQPNV